MKKLHLFVIATNQYAGNFEREMCAYLTGVTGECDVGKEMAEIYSKEEDLPSDFWDNVAQVSVDGFYRPCTICYNDILPKRPKDKNCVGIWFDGKPTEAQVTIMEMRALKFESLPPTNEGYEDLKVTGFDVSGPFTQVLDR